MSKPLTEQIEAPRLVEKPWGWERIFAHTEQYVGKVLHINAGGRLSRQYHRVKDETIYVRSGRLILEVGQGTGIERVEIGPDRAYRVVTGTVHRFIAPDDTDCELLEVSTPQLDDVVRIEDVYGREGTSQP